MYATSQHQEIITSAKAIDLNDFHNHLQCLYANADITSPAQINDVLATIKSNPNFRSLRFENCTFTPDAMHAIIDALEQTPITSISFLVTEESRKMSSAIATALAEKLAQSSTIKILFFCSHTECEEATSTLSAAEYQPDQKLLLRQNQISSTKGDFLQSDFIIILSMLQLTDPNNDPLITLPDSSPAPMSVDEETPPWDDDELTAEMASMKIENEYGEWAKHVTTDLDLQNIYGTPPQSPMSLGDEPAPWSVRVGVDSKAAPMEIDAETEPWTDKTTTENSERHL